MLRMTRMELRIQLLIINLNLRTIQKPGKFRSTRFFCGLK